MAITSSFSRTGCGNRFTILNPHYLPYLFPRPTPFKYRSPNNAHPFSSSSLGACFYSRVFLPYLDLPARNLLLEPPL